ncbi:MAG: hypothetical protein C4B57_10365 [Deltaproteobacteria bacterium]|nr:MAG: hypothetical protein C4B57_10365 [Deltaproteobacteria bacterium]
MQTRGPVRSGPLQWTTIHKNIYQISTRITIRPIIPNYAAAKFAKDARRKARRRTFVLQVPDNKADLVKLAAPCDFKYRTIFNSGGMHLLGEHSKLDNTP